MNAKTRKILLSAAAVVLAVILGLALGKLLGAFKRNDLKDMTASFTVEDENGREVELSDFYGKKPIVVNFWAIWCPPCKAELPDFEKAYKKYGDDVEFIMVNMLRWQNDTIGDVQAFMSENGYSFPVYYDVERSAEEAYAVDSIPLTLFIGKDGKVKYTYSGTIPQQMLTDYIERLI